MASGLFWRIRGKTVVGLTLVWACWVVAAQAPESAKPERPQAAIHAVYVVPFSHLDIGFTCSVPELVCQQKRDLDWVLDYLSQDPAGRWTVESVWQLDQWLAQTPEAAQVQRMRNFLSNGQLEIAAGYAGLHQGLLGPEVFNRSFGPARQYEAAWGLDLACVLVDDVPGSSWAFPQTMRENGLRYLVAGINTTFGGRPTLPVRDTLFTWQGPDGSAILTWLGFRGYAEGIFDYWLTAGYPEMAIHTRAVLDDYEQAGYPCDAVLALVAFDNYGPDFLPSLRDNIDRWNREHADLELRMATPREFFDYITTNYPSTLFRTVQGDWSGRWENLDQATPFTTARQREGQALLTAAETFSSLAEGLGTSADDPTAALDLACRALLDQVEHSGPGGGNQLTVAQITANNQWFWDRVVEGKAAVDRVLQSGLQGVARAIRRQRPVLAVFNGLGWARSDLVHLDRPLPRRLVDLATGGKVPVQGAADGQSYTFLAEDVPAFGYRLYREDRGASAARSEGTPNRSGSPGTIESARYWLAVDLAGGDVLFLQDRLLGRDLVADADRGRWGRLLEANQANAVVWGGSTPVDPGSVCVTAERGPVFSRLTVERSQSPLCRTVITLPNALARVEWRHTLDLDRTRFAGPGDHSYWYFWDLPFALGDAGFTLRGQGPLGWLTPQRDWMPGTGHNVRVTRSGADLRGKDGFGLTLAQRQTYLASAGTIGFWNNDTPTRPVFYPCLYTRVDGVDTVDQGWAPFAGGVEPGAPRKIDLDFALTTSGQGFDSVAADCFSDGFRSPLLPVELGANPFGALTGSAASLLATDQPNVVALTLKRAEYGNVKGSDLILRLQETAGRSGTVARVFLPFGLVSAERVDLGENPCLPPAPVSVNPLSLAIGPWQTVSLRLRPQSPDPGRHPR